MRWAQGGIQEHIEESWCNSMGCGWVVEEHQRWGAPEGGDVPEFTIEVAYKVANREGKKVTPGWRYALKWKENGEQRSERRYGYEEKEAALRQAKRRADEVALALAPVHVETYTPGT